MEEGNHPLVGPVEEEGLGAGHQVRVLHRPFQLERIDVEGLYELMENMSGNRSIVEEFLTLPLPWTQRCGTGTVGTVTF
jgi:hypothetical protein